MPDAIITARRIADRVVFAYLGPMPDDENDPARTSWQELYGRIGMVVEDEIGRAELLRRGKEPCAICGGTRLVDGGASYAGEPATPCPKCVRG